MPFNDNIQRIADEVFSRFGVLRSQEANLMASLADTQEQIAQLELTVNRAQSLLKGNVELPQNPCVNCYVFHERLSSMTPIPSETGVDMFRCDTCGDELRVNP